MLVIHRKNSSGVQPCVIRPVPLISINHNVLRNKAGVLGSFYDITLTGTIISDEGSPYYIIGDESKGKSNSDVSTSYSHVYTRPSHETVPVGHAMTSIIAKQNLLRELFVLDGQKFELLPAKLDTGINETYDIVGLEDEPVLIFYPTVQNVNFEEGIYVNTCKYTITLRAEVLLDKSEKIIADGLINSTFTPSGNNNVVTTNSDRMSLTGLLAQSGFVEDYNESWSIEVDEGKGTTNTSQSLTSNSLSLPSGHITSLRTYRLTRNVTATGRTMYYEEGGNTKRKEAWEQAQKYVYASVLKDNDNISTNNSTGYEQFPEYSIGQYFGSGFLNIAKDSWGGYNHLRTESIDVTNGTFTLNDTWLLSSGNAYEDYRFSTSKGSDNGLHRVSIEGTIKGLSSAHAGSTQYGGSNTAPPSFGNPPLNTQYQNALYKWHQVSNTGQYGPNCYLYRRANNIVHQQLNHIPLSISLGTNEFTGEITYSIDYDSRPTNIVSGALSENITCNDTYPGDIFAIIPVIGRETGPVLQYIGGRTEYKRDLTIELVMDRYYSSGNAGTLTNRLRQIGILSKPSLNEPFKSQIGSIIHAYSPIQEQGIRKYYVAPPVESWDYRTGRYSLQLNWTYELNR